MDQLASYRAEQKLKYEKKQQSDKVREELKSLFEFDPIKRSSSRIVKTAKRYFEKRKPVNESVLNLIPGKYRYRIGLTELNTFPCEVQQDLFENVTNGYDYCMKDALIQSFKDSYPILHWVVLDLREYGPCSEMAIYLTEYDNTFFLTEDQSKKIANIWNCINPDTSSGIRFQQMLDASKSLALIYNQLK